MIVVQHLISLLTALAVMASLAFWMIFIFVLAALKLLLGWLPAVRSTSNRLLELVYRAAAGFNSLWMTRVVGVQIDVEGELPDHPAPVILVNHQTWFDIPVVHHVITGKGPILKFLIKRQLIWVPIVGWICWALNFPRLNRGGGHEARQRDYQAIKSVSNTLESERGALLIFAEGTRFTIRKHQDQKSPYRHLLTPRPGGLKIALATLSGDTPIVDVTIAYHGIRNFWQCLGGSTRRVSVRLKTCSSSDITDSRDWLAELWRDKDDWMEKVLND